MQVADFEALSKAYNWGTYVHARVAELHKLRIFIVVHKSKMYLARMLSQVRIGLRAGLDYSHKSELFLLGRLYYSIVPCSEMSGSVCLYVCLYVYAPLVRPFKIKIWNLHHIIEN